MTKEQKQLLYNIAKWHSKEFYNRMEDNWKEIHYQINDECCANIRRLEKEYTDKYGPLPEWKYIDDVWAAIKEFKECESNGNY